MVHEHLDGTLTIRFGPQVVGRYNAQGWPLLEEKNPRRRKAVEKPLRGKTKTRFPTPLGNPATPAGFPLSHSHDGGGGDQP
jgi:hypothetical protein